MLEIFFDSSVLSESRKRISTVYKIYYELLNNLNLFINGYKLIVRVWKKAFESYNNWGIFFCFTQNKKKNDKLL